MRHPEVAMTADEVIAETRRWLERSVIGLNLCPFAESVYKSGGVRFRVSEQRSAAALLEEFRAELASLHAQSAAECETALLIHPYTLTDFVEYNDFLEVCEATIADMELEGELQVASFHPHYQFAGTASQDIENYTNRSPYPMLHVLREDSVERAVATHPDTEQIYLENIRTLQQLGIEGWRRLWSD
jgi:hypothetical protein